MAVNPTREQLERFLHADLDGEVVMLNLIRFRDRAAGAAGDEGATGADEYAAYGGSVVKLVEERGGTVLWAGRPRALVIGDDDAHRWDLVVLVSYPSREAFIEMTSSDAYRDVNEHREAGVADMALVACTPGGPFASRESS